MYFPNILNLMIQIKVRKERVKENKLIQLVLVAIITDHWSLVTITFSIEIMIPSWRLIFHFWDNRSFIISSSVSESAMVRKSPGISTSLTPFFSSTNIAEIFLSALTRQNRWHVVHVTKDFPGSNLLMCRCGHTNLNGTDSGSILSKQPDKLSVEVDGSDVTSNVGCSSFEKSVKQVAASWMSPRNRAT